MTLWCVLTYFDFPTIADLIVWPILILSVLLAIYTAFLFGQAKGRDFWQSPLLSFHMLLHSVVGGSSALLATSMFWSAIMPLMPLLKEILFWSLLIQLLSFAAEFLSSHPTEDAKKTASVLAYNYPKSKWYKYSYEIVGEKDENENFIKITRNEALKENNRIQFENNDVVGSISLKGAIIDDLTFKKYNFELNGKEKVVLLSPRKVQNGYFVESGFVTTNKNIEIPNSSTLWEISGNKKSVSYTHLTLPTNREV